MGRFILLLLVLLLAGCSGPRRKTSPVAQPVTLESATNQPAPIGVPVQKMFVSTLVGSPHYRDNYDGTNANARLAFPWGITIDHSGNIYFVGSNRVRQLTRLGEDWAVTTIAGTNATGLIDGLGSQARFDGPTAIAADEAGNLYVADTQNSAIRKLTNFKTNWLVTTIKDVHSTDGSVDSFNSPGLFRQPHGITVDQSGNLLVTDTYHQLVRKLAPSRTNWTVTTLAGRVGYTGSADGVGTNASFFNPYGIATDRAGNIFVTDYDNSTIRKLTLDGTNWVATTIAGQAKLNGSTDGTNSQALFYRPSGISIDPSDSFFVADSGNHTIRKLTLIAGDWVVTTVAGSVTNHGYTDSIPIWRMLLMQTNWTLRPLIGWGQDPSRTNDPAQFSQPEGVAADTRGWLYVADLDNNTIRLCRAGEPRPPPLRAEFTTNLAILSWDKPSGPFHLETSTASMQWRAVTNGIVFTNDTFYVTNTLPVGMVFFRFHRD
jgi:hypothetical protein